MGTMRPLPEIRSAANANATTTTTTLPSTSKPSLSNGDAHTHSDSSHTTTGKLHNLTNGVGRKLIVTRSKTGKVLRSGRRPLLPSSPWKNNLKSRDNNKERDKEKEHDPHQGESHLVPSTSANSNSTHTTPNPHVNGYPKNCILINGMSSRSSTTTTTINSKRRNVSSSSTPQKLQLKSSDSNSNSPATIGIGSSAYAKIYKSYRRNSSSCRRSLLLGTARRSTSVSPSKKNIKNNIKNKIKTNQRSLNLKKFKSSSSGKCSTASSGRLRITTRHCDNVSKVKSLKRSGGSKSKPKNVGVNGTTKGQTQQSKSRSASSSSSSNSLQALCSPKSSSRDNNNKEFKAQRRSALWVLNCEAEEFLFGETAADKHELELPPSSSNSNSNSNDSPPPKKRRRWRETELSHLLETSPFLESKLRSSSTPSSVSPSEHGNGSPSPNNHQPPKKRVKTKLNFGPGPDSPTPPTNLTPLKEKKLKGKNGIRLEEEAPRFCGPFNLNMELLSPRPYVDRAILLQETLDNVNWNYSFEHPQVDESWYSTFSRRGDTILSHKSFLPSFLPYSIQSQLILLPYQMNKPFLRRSRKKLIKNSRKSPRCHASTLAILSSEPPLSPLSPTTTTGARGPPSRSTRNSISSTVHPPPTQNQPTPPKVNPTPTTSTTSTGSLSALLISTTGGTHPPAPPLLSPFTKFVAENSGTGRVTRKRNSSSQDPYQLYQRTQKAATVAPEDLSSQQYLWDSIQFLSDPYVVALLSGDDPPSNHYQITSSSSSKSVSVSSSTRSRHASSKMVQFVEVVESRKASLRSCEGHHGGANSNGNGVGVVPLPKSSPNKSTNANGPSSHHHHRGVNNNINGVSKVALPVRSPTTRSATNKPPTLTPATCLKTPVVMVSDIMKGGSGNNNLSSKKKILQLEDCWETGTGSCPLLFTLGDGLPPLPSWPV